MCVCICVFVAVCVSIWDVYGFRLSCRGTQHDCLCLPEHQILVSEISRGTVMASTVLSIFELSSDLLPLWPVAALPLICPKIWIQDLLE